MKKIRKIFVALIAIFVLMVALPSMAGIAQSFIRNNNINEQAQGVTEEHFEEENNNQAEEVEKDHSQTGKEEDINGNIDEDDDKDIIEDLRPENNVDVAPNPAKKVFLTFDDGPSNLTPEILKILNENKVKATFFTIGKSVEKNPQWVKQAYDNGHAVLSHTYTHEYSIYTTFETYYNDLELAKKSIEDVLEIEIPYIFRFPGGSSNHSSFKYGGEQFMPKLTEDVRDKGYYYIDWNVSSGDASSDYDKKDKMISNVIEGSKNKDFIVVLFHDTARNTAMAEILPEIILQLKDQGYTFRSFRDITQDELDTMVNLKLANKPIIR